MTLQYRAEIYDPQTDTLATDAVVCETYDHARQMCEEHAQQPALTWQPAWSGLWEARTHAFWYRIVMLRG